MTPRLWQEHRGDGGPEGEQLGVETSCPVWTCGVCSACGLRGPGVSLDLRGAASAAGEV